MSVFLYLMVFGCFGQSEEVLGARRALLNVRELWCPIVIQLQRFMVAVHDERGGSARDPLVWDHVTGIKQSRADAWVNVDLALRPRPPGPGACLVRTLLPGLTALACCVSSLLS